MTPYLLFFVVFLVGAGLSLIENGKARRKAFMLYLLFAFPMIIIAAGFRSPNVDKDFWLYNDWFRDLIAGALGGETFVKDPAFAIVGLSLNSVGLGFRSLLIVYATLCLAGQFFFAKTYFESKWLPLGFFLILCSSFIPEEMTQIRASVAIPLLSFAILKVTDRKLLYGALFYGAALCFHFSVIIALPIVLLLACGASFKSRIWIAILPVLAVIGHLAFEAAGPVLLAFSRTSDYVNGVQEAEVDNLLNLQFLARVAIFLVGVYIWKKLNTRERTVFLCSGTGMVLEAIFMSNAAFAIRFAALFGLFDVVASIQILRFLHPRRAFFYVTFLLCLGAITFRTTTKIVEPYSFQVATEQVSP